MTQADVILFEREDSIARITLNRPAAGNAFDVPLARALMEASVRCDQDESIRCVILGAQGKLFCAGGDIASFAQAGESAPVLLQELTGYLNLAIARFVRMDKPLVTVINGPAAGAGIGLAVLGDIVLAARSAHFTLAHTALGLSPDGGCSWLLPRLIGLRRAQELILTNRRVSAQEAVEMGLITRAVDDAELEQEASAMAQNLAVAASAMGHARRLLASSFDASLETQLEAESRSIAELAGTKNARERITAFLEKRKPRSSP